MRIVHLWCARTRSARLFRFHLLNFRQFSHEDAKCCFTSSSDRQYTNFQLFMIYRQYRVRRITPRDGRKQQSAWGVTVAVRPRRCSLSDQGSYTYSPKFAHATHTPAVTPLRDESAVFWTNCAVTPVFPGILLRV